MHMSIRINFGTKCFFHVPGKTLSLSRIKAGKWKVYLKEVITAINENVWNNFLGAN